MLQCAVSDADIVTGVVCHASEFFYFSRDYYNACLFGTTRPLDAVWICTTHGNHFFTTGNTNTGSFAAFLIRQFVLNQSVDCLMLKRLPIPPRINSHVDGFRETEITNNLFPFSVYMWKRRHRESNTNNIYMLDSLASYWNTIIPYRQNTACDGMHIRKCAWLDSTTLGEQKMPLCKGIDTEDSNSTYIAICELC